jgi:hypothetical protein
MATGSTIMKTRARVLAQSLALLTACPACLVFSHAQAQIPDTPQSGNGADPKEIKFSVSVTNQYVNQTAVPVQLSITGGVPSYFAVLVNDTNAANATWQWLSSTNLSVMTPTDGVYAIAVGLCGVAPNAPRSWQTLTVYRETTPLTLALTNLAALSGSRPFIDPGGYATRELRRLTWTVIDANDRTNSGSGAVVAGGLSLSDQFHTTNWFHCVDLALAPGTNWISIQAADWAENMAVTNFAYIFTTNGDTTAPALTLVWPQERTEVSGDDLKVQAWTDDDTASAVLQYTNTDGIAQTIKGLVERGGNVWVQHVPLAGGTNSLILTATDAAGNVSTTNFNVIHSTVTLTVTPLTQEQMRYGYATVRGTVGDPDCIITVNGVRGTNYGDGTWAAENVPLAPGGSVVLKATAQMPEGRRSKR